MWTLALRNIWRDRRRTRATLLAFGFGVLGLAMFTAYIAFIEATMASVVIYQERTGHVQVYRRGGVHGLLSEPAKFSIPNSDVRLIRTLALSIPGAVLTTPQMESVGIVQNGPRSAVFLARGVVPEDDRRMRELGDAQLRFTTAEKSVAADDGILLTPQLARILEVSPTAEMPFVQLSSIAFDRRLNIEEAAVAGEFSTGIEETESKGITAPIPFLQKLYRTDSASRVVIVLNDRRHTGEYARTLQARLDRSLPDYEVHTWNDPAIGKLYTSFMEFFTVVFAFTGVIILAVCVLTVQSTIALSVLERMREIGTLRSIGFGRSLLAGLFAREALLLAVIGGFTGVFGAWLVAAVLSAAGFTTTPPRTSTAVPIRLSPSIGPSIAILLAGTAIAASFSYLLVKRRVPTAILNCFQTRAFCAVLFVLASALLHPVMVAQAADLAVVKVDKSQIAERIRVSDRARGGYSSYTWDLEIVSNDPGGRTGAGYRVDVKGDKAVAQAVSPASIKDETILIQGRAMWFMKPGLRRPVSVSPRQRLTGEAANGDIASVQYAENYRATSLGEEVLKGRPVDKVRLEAIHKDVTYDQVIYYLDKQSHLALKAEFLTVSGQPFKSAEMEYDNVVRHDGKAFPLISSMTIRDCKYPDRFSVLTYRNVRVVEHPDSRFTLSALGR